MKTPSQLFPKLLNVNDMSVYSSKKGMGDNDLDKHFRTFYYTRGINETCERLKNEIQLLSGYVYASKYHSNKVTCIL